MNAFYSWSSTMILYILWPCVSKIASNPAGISGWHILWSNMHVWICCPLKMHSTQTACTGQQHFFLHFFNWVMNYVIGNSHSINNSLTIYFFQSLHRSAFSWWVTWFGSSFWSYGSCERAEDHIRGNKCSHSTWCQNMLWICSEFFIWKHSLTGTTVIP